MMKRAVVFRICGDDSFGTSIARSMESQEITRLRAQLNQHSDMHAVSCRNRIASIPERFPLPAPTPIQDKIISGIALILTLCRNEKEEYFMNNPNLVRDLCRKYNLEITYKTYRMWHNVPHIGKTAIVIDEFVPGGGHRLIMNPKYFPEEIAEETIIAAIQHEAHSLGRIVYKGAARPVPCYKSWHNCMGDYPPGYLTHRLGIDVSCK